MPKRALKTVAKLQLSTLVEKSPLTWYPKLTLQLLKVHGGTVQNISSACPWLEGKSILQAVLDTLFGCPQLLVLDVNLSTSKGSQEFDG